MDPANPVMSGVVQNQDSYMKGKIAQRWYYEQCEPVLRDAFEEFYLKTGAVVDFIDFARSEVRFAKHFDKDGNPSETLLHAKADRLANWHTLQDLAGLR